MIKKMKGENMTEIQFVIRLSIALFLAIFIGAERQLTGHNAGIKTTVLIAIGTFVFASVDLFSGNGDVRMAANIITGIGFLCSGVIFKKGFTVNGLNTGATLWCTAAISILVSYGFIIEAVISSILMVLFNFLIAKLSQKIKPIKYFANNDNEFVLGVVCLKEDVEKVKKCVTDKNFQINSIEINSITDDKFRMKIKIVSEEEKISEIQNDLIKLDVLSVSFEKDEN